MMMIIDQGENAFGDKSDFRGKSIHIMACPVPTYAHAYVCEEHNELRIQSHTCGVKVECCPGKQPAATATSGPR